MGDYILFQSEYKLVRKSSKIGLTIIFLALALLTRIMLYISAGNPIIVEKLYSSSLYPYIGKGLGIVTSVIPFSIAEALLILMLVSGLIFFISIIIKPAIILRNMSTILNYLIRSLALFYILFYLLWGFNYYREDYSILDNMNLEPATYEELKELTLINIMKVNDIREALEEDNNGVFFLDDSINELGQAANLGFKNYKVGSISLDGNYGRIKAVNLSKYMSYTGITGIFIPFTSEPTVNVDVPFQTLLSTISHEMAHQRGFAKEDEANFISYKANTNNPDQRFQYSGYYLAMSHLMNELSMQNMEDYSLLYNEISDPVKRDLDFSREYWDSRKGKVRDKARQVNDSYLKSNNQSQGVQSYNGLVNLLLAEYKSQEID